MEKHLSKDAKLVLKRARIVLIIGDDEYIEIIRNENFSLNVIAILGMDYEGLVLLEEIGLWRTKPFHASEIGRTGRKTGKPGRRTCVPARSRQFSLTDEQYNFVAPLVFRILQEYVDDRAKNKWKRGPDAPYRIWSPIFKRTSGGKLYISRSLWEWPRGLRFSVCKESQFARDICWAERNLNAAIRNFLTEFAGSLHSCLSGYKISSLREPKIRRLKGYRFIARRLSCLGIPWHLLIETLEYLPINQFQNELADILGWDRSETEEKKLSLTTLSEPAARLGNIQIRTFGIKGKFLTFEVFPNI